MSEIVELDQLVRFVEHPVRSFVRQRLGISLGDWTIDLHDALPVELDGLESWQVGDRILQARLAGAGMDACVAAELARGHLPPGSLSGTTLSRMRPTIDRLLAATPAGEPDSVEVNVRLEDGRVLIGTVPGVVGGIARTVTYSRLKPRHRLAAWARYLALSAGYDVVTVARSERRGSQVSVARLPAGALDRSDAARLLDDLVALYDLGLCEPLPLYCATSAAWAAAPGDKGAPAARKLWEGGKLPGENRDAEHQFVLGRVRPFDDVVADPRFDEYARRLWTGLRVVETVEDR